MKSKKSPNRTDGLEAKPIISSSEVARMTLSKFGPIEVRERQNGSWIVAYPDPGFIPCPPNCDLQRVHRTHKHDYVQPFIETHYQPTSLADALDWANCLADGGEVRVVPYERSRRKLTPTA